jgi:protein phosphatase
VTALRAGGETDTGRVRDHNEDRFLITDRLFAVADGVGGHRAGEVASKTAVEILERSFTDRTADGLVEAVKEANRTVWNLAESNRDQRGMGTTLTAVGLVEDDGEERLAVVNVGDSRAYLLQQGELEQLTDDHSLVAQLVREGQLTPEEAIVHPQRSIITRALGLDPEVDVDIWELTPFRGDRILLCSDGLTNEVSDEGIASTLRGVADPQDAADQLVEEANARGGNDNITVVVIDVVDDDDRAEEASAALADEPAAPPSERIETRPSDDGSAARAGRAPSAPAARAPAPATRPEARLRRLTWRVVMFLVAVVVVIALSLVAVGWYARHTYFVGFSGDNVAIFKGRPGGLLWFDPTLERRTSVSRKDVPASQLADVRAGHEEPTFADAQRYVNLIKQQAEARTTTTTTTTPTPPPPAAP